MNRRNFIQLSTVSSALGAAVTLSGEEEPKPSSGLAVGHPVVMAPRTDGVEVVWRVSGLAKGYVEFGKTDELGEVARNDGWGLRPAGEEVIKVRIDGLEAGTEYHYRIVTENFDHKNPLKEEGTSRTFRTLSADATATSFAVWNDTHKHGERL